jgi:sugar/nucleoside kinase (ribokinase family)
MTDDIRPVDPVRRVALLIVGGLTIDDIDGQVQAAGGAARYATEGALAAGLEVALLTISGDEPIARAGIERLAARADIVREPASASIHFEHHGSGEPRRLRLAVQGGQIQVFHPDRIPRAATVLFAPVAEEVPASVLGAVQAPFRAAGVQGWLRKTDAKGWVVNKPLAELDARLAEALRGLDLLVASRQDLGATDGPTALTELRGWAGPHPELVVTSGTDGAWLDDGTGLPVRVPADAVTDRHTIGAGDAFAAVLAARRGAGIDLRTAATEAAAATARYLATRPAPG